MPRETRDHHFRRDGSISRELRPPDSFPWSGYESSLVLALDARFGIAVDTGINPWSSQGGATVASVGQATTTKQPALSSFGGRPSALYDNSDDRLKEEALSGMPAVGASFSVFAVVKLNNASGEGVFEFTDSSGDAVNKGMSLFQDSGNIIFRAYDGTGFSDASTAFSDTSGAHVLEATHETTTRSVRVDGGTAATQGTSRSLVALENLYVGSLGGSIYIFSGHIQSVLVLSPVLGSDDMDVIRGRLGSAWGVTVS